MSALSDAAFARRLLAGDPAAREESRQRCEEMLERLKRQREALRAQELRLYHPCLRRRF